MNVLLVTIILSAFTLVLGGCTQSNSGDVPAPVQYSALDRFLIPPNPLKREDGSFEVIEATYADAYYTAIDSLNERATLTGFRSKNSFGAGSGTEHLVVFRDTHDLGSGRRMIARRNTDGTLAFLVENYRVDVGTGLYTSINVDAAVARDTRWLIGTNGIEFSPISGTPTANCSNCVVKFYNFDPVTEVRQAMIDLDTRGPKAMPTVCVTCHGGRSDPLKPNGGFSRSVTSLTEVGNTQARLQPFDVASFEYSTRAGFTRADLEPKLRDLNQWVLCSYPIDTLNFYELNRAGNACRPDASPNEWWAKGAADMIKVWYGGTPNGSSTLGPTFVGGYVPADWAAAGKTALWNTTVSKYCRSCHIVRGTFGENQIDFTSFDGGLFGGFEKYKERIKAHVFERGNMPLSLYVFQNFWNDTAAVIALADFLEDAGTSSGTAVPVRASGVVPSIGRPIADPGPSRRINSGGALSAAGSVFATTFQWTVQSCSTPAATILNATASETTLIWTAGDGGTCTLQLTVGNSAGATHSRTVMLTKDSAIPARPIFADVRAVLQGTAGCTGCHTHVSDPAIIGSVPPVFYTDYNRGGTQGTAGDGTYAASTTDDDYWFYREVRGRTNLTDPAASPLLRKPTGNQHGGGAAITSTSQNYSVLANWILAGAPYN